MPKNISKKVIERLRILEDNFSNESNEIVATYKQIAEFFKVTPADVTNWMKNGRRHKYIKTQKLGKGFFKIEIIWSEIEDYKPQKTTHSYQPKVSVAYEKKTKIEVEEVLDVNIKGFKTFYHPTLGNIRAKEENGELYFVANDVCRVLGYSNPRKTISDHIDDEDKDAVTIRDAIGREQKTTIINESGLYTLILRSNKSQAKQFKHWVTSEVLPSIRKHGAYLTPTTIEDMISNPENAIKLLEALKKEQEKRKQLEDTLVAAKPYLEFSKAMALSEHGILIEDWAKGISRKYNFIIGRNRMFEWLRENGYIYYKNIDSKYKINVPYQKWIDKGYFEYYLRPVKLKSGITIERGTIYITVAGQIELTKKVIEYFKGKM